jgi:hypothetical protein
MQVLRHSFLHAWNKQVSIMVCTLLPARVDYVFSVAAQSVTWRGLAAYHFSAMNKICRAEKAVFLRPLVPKRTPPPLGDVNQHRQCQPNLFPVFDTLCLELASVDVRTAVTHVGSLPVPRTGWPLKSTRFWQSRRIGFPDLEPLVFAAQQKRPALDYQLWPVL